ncbi:MAG: hypothetical protein GF364_21125 [Candidatus Lokiarchaeota archaeon]|nr:hypothetical protein [Candidatus Lokiarchaeota archaeon]
MISQRYPFIEKAIRQVFEKLEVKFKENNKFSCCPEPNGIKNYNQYLYTIAAGRNLALAEKDKNNIVTPCNGCFETLKSIRSELSIETPLRNKVNKDLSKIDLQFNSEIDVMHILEYFAKVIGLSTIKDAVIYPLYGLRVAVHYGCHFLRPSNKIQTDSPLDPHIFDELVEALGAKSITYDDKMLCCGGSFDRAGQKELGLQTMKRKLDRIKEARADVIAVCCPQCFQQFDFLQRELKKMDYEYDIPVLYYPELLAIALGIPKEHLGLDKHVVKSDKIFEIIEEKRKANIEIQKTFDLEFLKTCYSCGACNDDCPPAIMSDFDPKGFVGRILDGDIDGCIEDPNIWACLDCYLCYELCPSKVGLVDIFTKLRNLAAQRGLVTEGFKKEYKTFLNKGVVGRYSITQRKRNDLPVTPPDVKDVVDLMKSIEERECNTKKKLSSKNEDNKK